jgi:4-diphosphocytidyl-2-C-methyl-D-erythritol kinase
MRVLAPAKVNLSLQISSRRDDSFHEIESLIAPISLYDELAIEKKGRKLNFRCDDKSVPQGEENLVVRAAAEFFRTAKLKPAVAIELRKKIPQGAGLGGGSSDAAVTLLALNQLFETKLPREALAEIGSTIGSDIPFFIFQSPAICKGRGERVMPAKLGEPLSILLLKPGFAVPTVWAYSRWNDAQQLPGISYEPQEFSGHTFVNDLERPVFEKFVFLAQVKTWLLKQPEVGAALMSGSGSTVFAAMRTNLNVDLVGARARKELDPELWTCGCNTL